MGLLVWLGDIPSVIIAMTVDPIGARNAAIGWKIEGPSDLAPSA